ncbi:MAG: IclR family transcriptional regulator [Terrimesophilobacter sp.]
MDSSLERGLALLSEIAESGDHTPQTLAAAVGLPVSTTYRYLRILRDGGYVQEVRRHYEPGRALLALTGRHSAQSVLAEIGPAILSSIVDSLGETAVMIVRVGTRALCLRRAEPDKALKYTFSVNQLLPLHAGAGQRVLLAWAPGTVIETVLGGALERYTGDTLTVEQLRHTIHSVRQTGWAVSRGEYEVGSVSVAVPVLFGGEAVCSLDVAGPESRCGGTGWVPRAVAVLQAAASDLTDALESWTTTTTPIEPTVLRKKVIA